MGGVEADEPPSKRMKVKPSSSSSSEIIGKSSVLGSSMADETIGSAGVRKVEFVRLIAEALHSLGYRKSGEYLEKESGITLSSSVVREFKQQILDGNWDESLNSLRKLSDLDESVVKSSSFLILEQKFLELLDGHKAEHALTTLRNEISPLSINQNRVRELSSLVLYSYQETIKPKPRSEVLRDLQKMFPPNVMIPEGRLLHLVEQALDLQRDACSFHNSLHQTSLFIDHNCGKDQIPSQTLQILCGHQDEVWFVEFSHNGKFLASSSHDYTAIIWAVSDDGIVKFKRELRGHKQSVSYVSWSPDDSQLLTCGVEEVVRRWDVFSGELLCVYNKNDLGTISCCWSPDGKRVFTGFNDKSIVMWDLEGNELDSWKGDKTLRISDLQITSDGKLIISICQETMLLIIDREVGNEVRIMEDHNILSFALSRDDNFLLVSLANQEIHLWSLGEKVGVVAKYKGHKCSRFVVRACFGGVGEAFVASGSEDCHVCIWHREGELLERLGGHAGVVNCTSWNPVNPHMLASASDDRSIRIWGLKNVDVNLIPLD